MGLHDLTGGRVTAPFLLMSLCNDPRYAPVFTARRRLRVLARVHGLDSPAAYPSDTVPAVVVDGPVDAIAGFAEAAERLCGIELKVRPAENFPQRTPLGSVAL